MNGHTLPADLAAQAAAHDWLLSLIRDPAGLRHIHSRPADEKQARMRAQLPRLHAFLDFIGNPERQFRSVHVAGTSGKGSVTQLAAALLTAAGQRTVDHISPYLQIPNEKLRIDGRLIEPADFVQTVAELRAHLERYQAQGGELAYGEAWVALTLLWAARQRPDWAVIETGMGGRFDPTNVLPSTLAVITNIGYDHMESLGRTLPEIAWHKAGIVKPDGVVITGVDQPEVLAVVAAEAEAQQATLIRAADRPLPDAVERALADLSGFQRRNARLALTVVDWLSRHFSFELSPERAAAVVRGFSMPGRLEQISAAPLVVLDGAHNPAKVAALAEALAARYPGRRWTVILGLIVNKDAAGIVEPLRPLAARFILTEPRVFGKPAAPADRLAALAAPAPTEIAPDVQTALDLVLCDPASAEGVLVTGSIYLVGEARGRWFAPEALLAGGASTSSAAA